jgi:hypothetical protein
MKKYSMYLWAALIVISMPVTLRAQVGAAKTEDIEAVKSRKLIAMIEAPNDRVLKQIAKKPKLGTVEDYRADLADYNANLKEVIEKFWPYNKTDIQYKTFEEIRELAGTGTKEYAVVGCFSMEPGKITPSSSHSTYEIFDGLHWVKNIKDAFGEHGSMFTSLRVNKIENFGNAPVFSIPLFDVFPTKAGLVYGLKTIDAFFTFKYTKEGKKTSDILEYAMRVEVSGRAQQLTGKTLLIREEWLDKDLNETNIKKIYPYPYKVVKRTEMDNVVMAQDGEYAYAALVPYVHRAGSVIFFHYLIDCADGQPLAMVKPGNGAFMGAGLAGGAGQPYFTEKIFIKMAEQISGKK